MVVDTVICFGCRLALRLGSKPLFGTNGHAQGYRLMLGESSGMPYGALALHTGTRVFLYLSRSAGAALVARLLRRWQAL